ncbi:MAG: hypothetical protein KDC27_06430 [Acidobacteria bacterium]|nr:hypothetical protein [Acidobacteriota bacterium]
MGYTNGLARAQADNSWRYELAFAIAGFATYFCAYSFRKPFLAAEFSSIPAPFGAIETKTLFVLSQVVGYALAKYLGVKVCSETPRARLAWMLAALILLAESALVAFALLPPALKGAAMFANGLALGMVWGHVVRFLEGRRASDLLLAVLCSSFVVSSGVVKDVGRALLDSGLAETWMPAATGALFLAPFFVAISVLHRLPAPDGDDEAERSRREPMTAQSRRRFFADHALGIVLLLGVYLFATAFRDFRDNYGVEMLGDFGYQDITGAFTRMELPIAFSVLCALGALRWVRDSRKALACAFALMFSGSLIVGASTLLLDQGALSGMAWLTVAGLGAYLTYIPYNAVLFERLWASTGAVGTAVFCIYLADAVGYGGSLATQLGKDVLAPQMSRLEYFRLISYSLSAAGCVGVAGAAFYFLKVKQNVRSGPSRQRDPGVVPAPGRL